MLDGAVHEPIRADLKQSALWDLPDASHLLEHRLDNRLERAGIASEARCFDRSAMARIESVFVDPSHPARHATTGPKARGFR